MSGPRPVLLIFLFTMTLLFEIGQYQAVAVSHTITESSGLTFTQSSSYLAANLTATYQAYRLTEYNLNGLSNTGYRYVASLHYCDFPCPTMDLEVHAYQSNGTQISWSERTLFNGAEHDRILLSLNFTQGQVKAYAVDWNTGESVLFYFNSYGATTFIGLQNLYLDSHGNFSGLETWQEFTAPYYGNTNETVYNTYGGPMQWAWMWDSEYDFTTNNYIFYNYDSVNYNTPLQFLYHNANGTASASNAYQFITGAPVVSAPKVSFQPENTLNCGGSVNVADVFTSTAGTPVEITRLRMTTAFGPQAYLPTSFQQFNLTSTGGAKTVVVMIGPAGGCSDTETLRAFFDWQFYDTNSGRWLASTTITQGDIPMQGSTFPLLWMTNLWIVLTLAALSVGSVVAAIIFLSRHRKKNAASLQG